MSDNEPAPDKPTETNDPIMWMLAGGFLALIGWGLLVLVTPHDLYLWFKLNANPINWLQVTVDWLATENGKPSEIIRNYSIIVGGGYAAYVAWRRIQAADRQSEAAQQTLQHTQKTEDYSRFLESSKMLAGPYRAAFVAGAANLEEFHASAGKQRRAQIVNTFRSAAEQGSVAYYNHIVDQRTERKTIIELNRPTTSRTMVALNSLLSIKREKGGDWPRSHGYPDDGFLHMNEVVLVDFTAQSDTLNNIHLQNAFVASVIFIDCDCRYLKLDGMTLLGKFQFVNCNLNGAVISGTARTSRRMGKILNPSIVIRKCQFDSDFERNIHVDGVKAEFN